MRTGFDEQGRRTPREVAAPLADEPMFLIADMSVASACRVMLAADIDYIDRQSVRVTQGGFLVTHCIYEQYHALLDAPTPCCNCGLFGISFANPNQFFAGDSEGRGLVGNGFAPGMQLTINGFPLVYDQDYAVLSPNYIDVWGIGEIGSLVEGQQLTYEVTYGTLVSTFVSPPALPRPAKANITSASPATAARGTTVQVMATGTNFREGDLLAIRPPGQFGQLHYPTIFVSATELQGDIVVPADDPYFPAGSARLYIWRTAPSEYSNYIAFTIT